ncbi:MAG TPA: hypothetical protein PLD20_34355 [Blastocatellia bacterium]|nr:hypothetical protein [Blastocatellia bacterium]HMY71546.1 hypothetical protein [Blastocatellia bacterium]HMZ23058.1 hypothetical protein [Blastocatellia bacterium]
MFFTLGLCGLVCCVSPQAAEASQTITSDLHAEHEIQPTETGSHCHSKAEKNAPVKPRKSVRPHISAAPNCHGGKLAGRSVAAFGARICGCDAEEQPIQAVSSAQSDSTQQKCAVAVRPVWLNAEQSLPQPAASPPILHFSSPPFSGHQLSLRI